MADRKDEERRQVKERLAYPSGARDIPYFLRRPYLFLDDALRLTCDHHARFLDFGCGDGRHMFLPARLGADVIGIDISEKYQKLLKQRVREGYANIAVVIGDCQNLPFADNSFDIVFHSGVLLYMDIEAGLSEIVRVLKPDGYFLSVDTLDENPVLQLRNNVRYRRRERPWHRRLRLNDTDTVKRWFGSVDMKLFDITVLPLALLTKEKDKLGQSVVQRILRDVAWWIDDILVRLPLLRRLAFKIVWIASVPRKELLHEVS